MNNSVSQASAMTADQPAPGRTLGALVWEHFLNDGMANYVPGILPLLVSERHFSLVLVGSLLSLITLAQMLQPMFGIVADRLGGRWFMLWGPVCTALGGIGVAIFPSVAMVLMSLVLIGIGNNVFHPQALATVRRRVRAGAAGLAMSIFLIGGELGRAVGPVMVGALAVAWGLNGVWLMAVPIVLTWPLVMRWIPSLPATRSARLSLRGLPFRPAAPLIVYAALRAVLVLGLSTYMPLVWRAEGGQVVAGASLVTALIGAGTIGNAAGGALRDRVGPGPVVWFSLGMIIVLLAILIFHVAHGVWMWPVLGGIGAALFASWPSAIMAVQDIFHANPSMGSGLGLGFGNGIGAVLSFPLAFVAAHWGLGPAVDTLLGVAILMVVPVSLVPAWRLNQWGPGSATLRSRGM
jgi:FSR family fosmidomycin resistance protein-like MFS transporter